MADWEIFLATDAGVRLRVLEKFVSASIGLDVNAVGPCSVTLDGLNYDFSEFKQDYRLEFERGGVLQGGAPFVLSNKKSLSLSREGEWRITLHGHHANHLLTRREIAYYAGSSGASSTVNEYCDNLIKRLARLNLANSAQTGPHVVTVADGLRDYPAPDLSAYFTVASDISKAAQTNKSFARRDMLAVMQEVALDSYQQGTPLFFGIEENGDGLLEFRTRVNQWGSNQTGKTVVSPEFKNLVDAELSEIYNDEITVAYALGDGEKESRVVEVVLDDRRNSSVFNWRERMVDAENGVTSSTVLQAEARAALRAGQPRIEFTGQLQETPAFRYGVEWDWGARVDVEFAGFEFDAWINKVQIDIGGDERRETISAKIETVQ